MRSWIRWVRGALGMGLTWAVGWAPIGALVGASVYVALGGWAPALSDLVLFNATVFAVLGFIGGTLFASVLRLAEGRRRFDELSLPRVAAWGGIGGMLLGVAGSWTGFWDWYLPPAGAGMLLAMIAVGSGSAVASLTLARRAEGAESVAAELTEADPLEAEWRHPTRKLVA